MSTNTNTKTALPLDQNGSVDQAAVEAQRAEMLRQPPGHRVLGSVPPRQTGEPKYLATLRRGVSFRFVAGQTFERGKPAPVDQRDFEYLSQMADSVVFSDGEQRWRRHIRRFAFTDLAGNPVELPPIEDEPLDPPADDNA